MPSTARFDLSDYGRVQLVVELTGDIDQDSAQITNALISMNRATLNLIEWAEEDRELGSLSRHLVEAWNGGPRQQAAPSTARPQNGRPAPTQRRSAQPRSPGTGYFCPDHNMEVEKTPAQYDADGDRYQHLYPQGEVGPQGGKRHTLYYRQLVDRNGDPLPPLDAQPVAAGYDDAPPYTDDDAPF